MIWFLRGLVWCLRRFPFGPFGYGCRRLSWRFFRWGWFLLVWCFCRSWGRVGIDAAFVPLVLLIWPFLPLGSWRGKKIWRSDLWDRNRDWRGRIFYLLYLLIYLFAFVYLFPFLFLFFSRSFVILFVLVSFRFPFPFLFVFLFLWGLVVSYFVDLCCFLGVGFLFLWWHCSSCCYLIWGIWLFDSSFRFPGFSCFEEFIIN